MLEGTVRASVVDKQHQKHKSENLYKNTFHIRLEERNEEKRFKKSVKA